MDDLSLQTRYGIANPERVENPLWQLAMARHWSAAQLLAHFGVQRESGAYGSLFYHSSYRDLRSGPFWSWQRVRRTSTPLLDGRIVHVAGHHEDFYDSNFCIYNDVVVEHTNGLKDIFLYPKDVFPPTDYHTATAIGGDIFLIGAFGYKDLRRPGETQVLRLSTDTFSMQRLVTHGDGPGWIDCHRAEQISDAEIQIFGGTLQEAHDRPVNSDFFTLDLNTMAWRRDASGASKIRPDECLCQELEAVEIELLLSDEKFPLPLASLKLLGFFDRNPAGNWVCIRPITIALPNGEELLIRPRQTFSHGMFFCDVNLYEHLQHLARRADLPRPSATG